MHHLQQYSESCLKWTGPMNVFPGFNVSCFRNYMYEPNPIILWNRITWTRSMNLFTLVREANYIYYWTYIYCLSVPGAASSSGVQDAVPPCRGGTSCHAWVVVGWAWGWPGAFLCLLPLGLPPYSTDRRSVRWRGLPGKQKPLGLRRRRNTLTQCRN